MVSFSLRLRISYLLLQDSSLVSFHLIQFGKLRLKPTRFSAETGCGKVADHEREADNRAVNWATT